MNGSALGGITLESLVLVGLAVLVGCALPPVWGERGSARAGELTLSAKDLYGGLEARKVLLDKAGEKLVLDERVLKFGKEKEGRAVTDPIDLGPAEGLIGLGGAVGSVEIEVKAEVPRGPPWSWRRAAAPTAWRPPAGPSGRSSRA